MSEPEKLIELMPVDENNKGPGGNRRGRGGRGRRGRGLYILSMSFHYRFH